MCQDNIIPIKGFSETSFLDWKEHLSAVLFTGGCNFRCPFCHNKDLVINPQALGNIPVSYVFERLKYHKQWVDRVVVTGGEPTILPGLPGFLEALVDRGFMVKLDTNGSHPRVVKNLVEHRLVHCIAMDVKGPLSGYRRWCGVAADQERIAESISFIRKCGIEHEFRMTVVPFLHQEKDVYEVARMLKGSPFFVQAFAPRNTVDPSFMNIEPFSEERMAAIRIRAGEIMQDADMSCAAVNQDRE